MQNTLKCVQDEDHKALIFFFFRLFPTDCILTSIIIQSWHIPHYAYTLNK